ncbi:MAG: tetratricopeptide repeat protein, partial [Chloroflexota bacterium]
MRLFICTEKADEVLLDVLTDILHGYRMTVDIDRIIGQRDSRPTLQASIQDCDAFVFAATRNSLQSKRCLWEFGQAMDNDRPIIIALLEQLDPFPKAFDDYLVADLTGEGGAEVLLDALYVVGATPPSILRQLLRNRLLLSIVILIGFLIAWLAAGPYSPFRDEVAQTITGIINVSDRTVDINRPIPTRDPNDPELIPIRAMTLSASAQSLFATGQEQARNGNYPEAIETYNRVLDITPGSAGAHIARGNALLAIDALDTAWGDFTRAIELSPDLALPYISRAAFYVTIGEADGALADLEAAVAIEPDNAEIHDLRAQAYFIRGQFDEALVSVNRAIELDSTGASSFSNRGEIYRFQGRYKVAREDFDRAIQLNPLLAESYSRRGALAQSQNNTAAALDDFTRAIELNPSDANARYGRALIYSSSGEYALAAADFSRSIIQQPDDPNLYLLRGTAYRCAGEPPLAVADFTTAADLALDVTVEYLRRPGVYECIGQPAPEVIPERVGLTDAAIEGAYFVIADRLVARAEQHLKNGDVESAVRDYTVAAIMTPSFTEVATLYFARGAVFEANGDLERALADYEAAVSILPERSDYYVSIGNLLVRQGETEDAFRQYARALELNP